MKISFHGACREVTGSCYLVETTKSRFLVDCGLFQGAEFAEEKNLKEFVFDPASLDFVLLTHAHIDHCGRLPKLYKEGFRKNVYATAATADFTDILLHDSAKVIAREAQENGTEPIYRDSDVTSIVKKFKTLEYRKKYKISTDITVRFRDAGHILGSAFIEVWVKEGSKTKKIIFSGDLGNPPAPIVCDTEFANGADTLIIESTYGGRIHEPSDMRLEMLQKAVIDSVGKGGTLLIPSFALERTQEVLYELNSLAESGKIPHVPIFVDSPLAFYATEVYRRHENIYDKKSQALISSGDDIFHFSGLQFTPSVQQSKKINITKPPKIIIAGSGMITGGRMPYHLKFNISNPKTHLLFIAYQVEGSLGWKLLKQKPRHITVAGETVFVRAKVSAIGSYSAHADQPKLLSWAKRLSSPEPQNVFITHGEEKSARMLADGMEQKLKWSPQIPEYGKEYII